MKYKIEKIKHASLTPVLLRLCAVLPDYYFDSGSKEESERILDAIREEAKRTKFLLRNTWVPLESHYTVKRDGDSLLFVSVQGKTYLEFRIVEA